jgi:hypothetical protein
VSDSNTRQSERLGDEGKTTPVCGRLQHSDHGSPFRRQLGNGMIPLGPFPLTCGGELAHRTALDLQNQQPAVRTKHQEITLTIGVVVVAPANEPVIGEPIEKLGDPELRFVAFGGRAIVDPRGHGLAENGVSVQARQTAIAVRAVWDPEGSCPHALAPIVASLQNRLSSFISSSEPAVALAMRGSATTTAKHCAREMATLIRLRSRMNASPREPYSP